jgi:hypothetical protein
MKRHALRRNDYAWSKGLWRQIAVQFGAPAGTNRTLLTPTAASAYSKFGVANGLCGAAPIPAALGGALGGTYVAKTAIV